MHDDVYCALPFSSISIDGPGRPRLCCNNTGHYMIADGIYASDLDDPIDAMNTDLHREVRLAISRGERHASCGKCWKMEDSGSRSFRQIWNGILGTDHAVVMDADGTLRGSPGIRYLDITLGNKCNLVCRMCNWANSHLWHADNAKLGRYEDIDERLVRQFWFEDDGAMDMLARSIASVTHMNFLGGEPLIVPQHLRILQACIDSGRASDIEVSYNTNLTRLPDGILDLWTRFKRVAVNVSLEGIDLANDYIRQNSSWPDIVRNIEQVGSAARSHGSINMDIHATLGIYNALSIHELISFARDVTHFGHRLPFINMVYKPEHQDVRYLPAEARDLVSSRIMAAIAGAEADPNHNQYLGAINYMMGPRPGRPRRRPGWPVDNWLRFWHDADQIDALKGRNMADYLPELNAWRPR